MLIQFPRKTMGKLKSFLSKQSGLKPRGLAAKDFWSGV
jgi:hypothetical protein